MAIQPQLCTVAEFDRFIALPEHRDQFFELIHGEIVEKVPTEELVHSSLSAFSAKAPDNLALAVL